LFTRKEDGAGEREKREGWGSGGIKEIYGEWVMITRWRSNGKEKMGESGRGTGEQRNKGRRKIKPRRPQIPRRG
jgi:hypothetical protein